MTQENMTERSCSRASRAACRFNRRVRSSECMTSTIVKLRKSRAILAQPPWLGDDGAVSQSPSRPTTPKGKGHDDDGGDHFRKADAAASRPAGLWRGDRGSHRPDHEGTRAAWT